MQTTYTAFCGVRYLTSCTIQTVSTAAKQHLDQGSNGSLLIFDDTTGKQVDIDLRGDIEQILERLQPAVEPKKPGRPSLGVVAREITLLPRHWDWLNQQPSGASATLRKLVEAATRADGGQAQLQSALDRFMMVMAGNLPGYESAARALYGGDYLQLETLCSEWPEDIRAYVLRRVELLKNMAKQNQE